ncbi:translation factor [Mesoplasma chauliocola]|uniref:L-threonylcarbamoyladenylate synthase n=1 Tax=Mesoplasma chauliocola TaxID=216427 RepID=A0A249SP59_9MOLU|nr:Sua5/YciO/YrdC/YwlC family protein [Mesoplasma chauliocola]ASZ09402.1 translation factor [Mesoplasma chauliocola]
MLKKEIINECIEDIKANKIVIIPTDTIYGLSAKISKDNEIKINQIKNIKHEKPLITLVSNFQQLKKLQIKKISKEDKKILLDSRTTVIFETSLEFKTIAVRFVKRKDIKKIINKTGPIFSTSVNKHGLKPINKEEELKNFDQNIKLFFDIEPTDLNPSKIYNSLTKKWIR